MRSTPTSTMEKTPVEVMDLILENCDTYTLRSLSLTSRKLEILTARNLWACVTVDPKSTVWQLGWGCFFKKLHSPRILGHVSKVIYTPLTEDPPGVDRLALSYINK